MRSTMAVSRTGRHYWRLFGGASKRPRSCALSSSSSSPSALSPEILFMNGSSAIRSTTTATIHSNVSSFIPWQRCGTTVRLYSSSSSSEEEESSSIPDEDPAAPLVELTPEDVEPVIQEAKRVLSFQERFTKDVPKGEQIQGFITELLDAVDDLLAQTEVIMPLLLQEHKTTTDETSSEEPTTLNNNFPDIRATLHPAFLAATQWCLLISASPRYRTLLSDNPFLELAFRLATVASELDIPFHLPLYRQLIEAAAQQSLNPVTNISNTLRQTRHALGPIQASFCGPALVLLAKRGRLMDVCNLLVNDLQQKHSIENLDPATTKALLKLLNPYIKNVLHLDRYESPMERDAVCLTLLLESSIWNSLGTDGDETSSGDLQDGIEAILESSWDDDDDNDEGDLMGDDFKNEIISTFGDDVWDGDEGFDEFQAFTPDNESEEHLKDLIQAMADAGGTIPEGIDLKVMQSGDETILAFTDKGISDDSSDEIMSNHEYNELEVAELLYRPRSEYGNLPDLSHQLFSMNGHKPLLYSKDFENHLMDQIVGTSDGYRR